jgi:thiol-disulfide isomerase/thioredoxin
VAALAALVAAVIAAAVLSSLPGREAARPAPEVRLEFSGDDQDPAQPLVGGDATGQALPSGRYSRLEGGLASFADYQGKPLVVNFFASWCVPCVTEMPDLERVHQEFGDGVAFVGVNLRDQVSDAQALVARTGVTYDVIRDPSGALAQELGVVGMPTTFFVTPDGRIVDTKAGAFGADELRQRVEKLSGS